MPGHVSARATGQHHLMSSRLTHSHGEHRTDVIAPMITKAQSEPELRERLKVTLGEPGQMRSSLTVIQLNENGIEESSAHKQSGNQRR